MKLKLHSKFSQYIAIFVTILITLVLIKDSANSWFSYIYASDPPPTGLENAYSLERGNAEFYFLLAQYYNFYDYTTPREKIYPLYKKALELNPFNYGYWFALAQFLSRQDRKEDARFALEQAIELSPGVVALRWEAGMLASELGDRKLILENMASVIAHDPHRQTKAYMILWESLKNGEDILKIVPTDAYPSYLHFLISTRRINEAMKLWNKIEDKNTLSESLFLRYVDFLIYHKELKSAIQIWIDRLGDWEGVWNGGFEEKTRNSGFDWRINKNTGASVTQKFDTVENTNLVEIEFDGKNDADVHLLSQFIPVNGNTKYDLSIKQKSKDLFTGTGLFWEVYCPSDNKLLARTSNIRGTSNWRDISLSFETPYSCNLVSLRLISNRSERKMNGKIWIDKVVLKEIDDRD